MEHLYDHEGHADDRRETGRPQDRFDGVHHHRRSQASAVTSKPCASRAALSVSCQGAEAEYTQARSWLSKMTKP